MDDLARLERIAEAARAEADFQFSGAHAVELRSPLYEALARYIADSPDLLSLLATAPQPNVRSLLAAVHLRLLDGVDHPLRSWYPTVGGARAPDGELLASFHEFVVAHRAHLHDAVRARGVQTNEVRRSATLLLALGVAAEMADGPLTLIELGASAGLNLLFDRYRYVFSSGARVGSPTAPVEISCEIRAGEPPIPELPLPIASRVGVDLDPVAVTDPAALQWLRACIWGDHPDRLSLLDAAVAVAIEDPPQVIRGDMVDAVAALIDATPAGTTPVVFHTNAVNYLRRDRRQQLVDAIVSASAGRRLLWLSGEGPGVLSDLPTPPDATQKAGIPIVLTDLRDEARRSQLLALAGVQGTWIDWRHDPSRR